MENLQVKTLREKDVGIRCDGSMRMGADESCISPKVGHWGGGLLRGQAVSYIRPKVGQRGHASGGGMRAAGYAALGSNARRGARAGSFHPKALQPINPVGK